MYRGGVRSSNKLEGNSWRAMRGRCLDKNYRYYHRYGGRGIKICERWLGEYGFVHFLEDMGKKPTPKHSLDRIDNDGDYTPDNCRWATQLEQVNNSTNIKYIEVNGVRDTLKNYLKKYGLNRNTYYDRVNTLGWSVEEAIVTPLVREYRGVKK